MGRQVLKAMGLSARRKRAKVCTCVCVHYTNFMIYHNPLCLTGKKKVQTDPPSIAVADLFPGGIAPEGEWQSYKDE